LNLNARKNRISAGKHAQKILRRARIVRNAICHQVPENPEAVFDEYERALIEMQHLLKVEMRNTKPS